MSLILAQTSPSRAPQAKPLASSFASTLEQHLLVSFPNSHCSFPGVDSLGVAWALVNGTSPPRLRDIHVVSAWASDYIQDKVPSLYTYSPEHGQRWGWDIENNMYVIRQPKLELPEPKTLDALKKLKCAVKYDRILREAIENGTRLPIHVTKGPYDVTRDYLFEVAKAAHDSVEKNLPPGQLKDFPIDIVVTHPAVSYQ